MASGALVPRLRKAAHVDGRHLRFQDASEGDAAFIHRLRTDPVRARFMSAVSAELADQVQWLRTYADDDSQAYFVIRDQHANEPLGTVRLYGALDDAFCWGSWMLLEDLPARVAIESALMVYAYARWLGFVSSYFEVKKDNRSVWRFHERFGARRVGERGDQYQYQLDAGAMTAALRKYQRFLPDGIRVDEQ